MIGSAVPTKIPVPFASGAGSSFIREVPVPSQIGVLDGAASWTDGFVPLNAIFTEDGGVPPFIEDINGAINRITKNLQWWNAGGSMAFDNAFATAVGGYPSGAVIQSADSTGWWRSTTDNNTNNPDTGGAGWLPHYFYGLAPVTGINSGTTTLTVAQWRKPVLVWSGTLTNNAVVVFPAGLVGEWLVRNIISMDPYTVTAIVAGSSATPVPINAGSQSVWSDGTDLYTSSISLTSIPIATHTVQGITRLATTAEDEAGTLDDCAVTPLGLQASIAQGAVVWCGVAGGTANAIVLTPTVPIPAYHTGVPEYGCIIATTNTTATTVNISGRGVKPILTSGPTAPVALVGGEMVAGAIALFRFDGTNMQVESHTTVPAATHTVVGIVRLATVAESAAGVDDTISVTPAGLSAAVGIGSVLDCGIAGGSANAIVLTPASPITAYGTHNPEYIFQASSTNTTATTVNISGVGVVNLFSGGVTAPAALVGGEIVNGDIVSLRFDGTRMQLISRGVTPRATHAIIGITRLATVGEAIAGVDDTIAVTPAGLSAAAGAGPVLDCGVAGGTANHIILTPSVPITSYGTRNPEYIFQASNNNTGPTDVNISGVGVVNLFWGGITTPAALSGGEIITGDIVSMRFDGTQLQMISRGGIPLATHAVAGIAPLASVAEAINGTDDQKIVTCKDLAAVLASDGGPPKLKWFKMVNSGTFTTPATSNTSTSYEITAIGGGATDATNTYPASSGDSVISMLTGIAPSTAITVTIGAAGAGGHGGDTIFGSYVRALGGDNSGSSVGDLIIPGGRQFAFMESPTLLGFPHSIDSGTSAGTGTGALAGYGYGVFRKAGICIIKWIG